MNAEQTPQEISALIAIAEEEIKKEDIEMERRRVEDQEAGNLAQRKQAQRFFDAALPLIPDVIRPFVKLDDVYIKNNQLYDLVWNEHALEFHIPGLAPIAMLFEYQDKDGEKPKFSEWIVSGVSDDDYDDDLGVCTSAKYTWIQRYAQRLNNRETDLRRVLFVAKESAEYLHRRLIENESMRVNAVKNQLARQIAEERVKSEEQALFDALKNDPVAIHMLKAFVLLRDERSIFESRLEEADAAMYSIENRWSSKAEELRRQADAMQRRADDERRRLEDDLSDAESKLKKAQRGW